MKNFRPWQVAVLLGALAALIAVVKYGVGTFPSWIYLYDIGRNWSDPSQAQLMGPPADYLQPNFLLAWLAGLAGFLTSASYFTFHLLFAVIAVTVVFWMPVVRQYEPAARLMFIAVAGGPIAALMVMWANGYDALTVIGIVVGSLSRRPWWAFLGWLLSALNHPIVGLIGFAAWAAVVVVQPNAVVRWWRLGLGAVAAGLGWICNEAIMHSWGGYTTRAEWRELVGVGDFWDLLWPSMPVVVFGAVGVGWLVLLHPMARRQWWIRLVIVELVVGSIVLAGVSLDATRVAALVLLAPVLTALIHLSRELNEEVTSDMWKWWAIVAVIVPIPLVFTGEVLHTGWDSFGSLDTALLPPEGYELLGQ